ncbi:MAG TPA: tetratricopeptide repeat protein, partial [Vicinamibacterales bacterium]|nr:tetratricopeptide repeat protein [Vicinamibacterales bacterium]
MSRPRRSTRPATHPSNTHAGPPFKGGRHGQAESQSLHAAGRRRLRLTVVTVSILAVASGGVLAYRTLRPGAPAPPTLADLGPLAPEIADIVGQARESVVQDPRDGMRWGRFAMVCEANGLPGAARDAYVHAAALQPSEPKWPFHLAVVESRLGESDAAVRDMRRSIELNPAYAAAYWRLGLWLLDQNQTEGAERAFSRATEIDAADRAGWIGLARVYLQRDENERAAGLLERLVAANPGEGYALQLLGTAYRRLGRGDEAAAAAQVGARGEPQWSDPWTDEMASYRRGYAALLKDATAYIVAGRSREAIGILEQLRRDRPDDVVLMAHLGQVYVAAGRDSDAVPLLESVIAREPDRFEAHVDLATAYMHLGNLAKARQAVERAIAANGSYAPAYETLGLVQWRDGRGRDAIAAFERSVQIDPRNARALVWKAMVETNGGRAGDALASFERAAQIDPTSVDAWIGIANAQLNRRDLEAAAAALRNAQRLQPDRPAVKATADRLKVSQA